MCSTLVDPNDNDDDGNDNNDDTTYVYVDDSEDVQKYKFLDLMRSHLNDKSAH